MYRLVMEKASLRHLDPEVIGSQLKRIISRALGGNRGKTWGLAGKVRTPEAAPNNGSGHLYRVEMEFIRSGRKAPPDVVEKQWERIQEMAANAGRSKGWLTPGRESEGKKEEETHIQPKSYAPTQVPTDLGTHFDHLYEREPQIALIHSALKAYTESQFEDRFHAVLYGPPACGKTEILRSFNRMLGNDAVLNFDATSTTKAGAERILLETANIPPVLIVEEIEKTDEQSLRWLLGILDHRGEIRKVTHRIVSNKKVKLLCLATVNDMGLFRRGMDGALASRFSHQIYCPRPSRTVLERILDREILRCNGKKEWIKPALDWCIEEEKTNDPRRVITVCLCGRDKLLDGSYQNHLRATKPPKE